MSAPQMLAHITEWMRMAKGDITVAPRRTPLRLPGFKQFAVYWMPFPKGLPTAPELIDRTPTDWNGEIIVVRGHIDEFATMNPRSPLPPHPMFGNMTPAAWGVLGYRHTDHHLRQFGV